MILDICLRLLFAVAVAFAISYAATPIVKKLALTNLNIYNAYTNINFVALFII